MKEFKFSAFTNFSPSQRLGHIKKSGAFLISEVPLCSNTLLEISNSFGEVVGATLKARHYQNQEDGGIYLVQSLQIPLRDKLGNTILSTSNLPFPLHTDQFTNMNPANIIVMLCYESDKKGGETILSDVRTIVKTLPQRLIKALEIPFIRIPTGLVSVLTVSDMNAWNVRFNLKEIHNLSHSFQHYYSKYEHSILKSFDKAALECASQFSMRRGDCLILDNWRFLHGRTATSMRSNRLLKRVRVNLNCNSVIVE